jgi:hypothetical protein
MKNKGTGSVSRPFAPNKDWPCPFIGRKDRPSPFVC